VIVIKISGAAVFVAAALVGAGVLFSRPALYYVAIGLCVAAFLAVIASAIPWRRRPRRYP